MEPPTPTGHGTNRRTLMANQKYEAFLTVAETHSFKKAAERMGYTQAGISYLINMLERELDLPLFVRDYGDTRLTADGRELYPLIQAARGAERQLETRVSELKHLESGLVRVAAFTSTAIQWFPSIAKAFFEEHPLIDLKLLCIDDEQELAEAVWSGQADCGFCVAPLRKEFDAVLLRRDPLLVVVSPDSPMATQRIFSADDLASQPYIQLMSNGRPSEMEALFKANGVEPSVRFTVDSDYAVMSSADDLASQPYIQLMSNGRPSEMEALFKANGVEPSVRFTVDSDYAVMSMVSANLGFSVLPDLILRHPPFPLVTLRTKAEAARDIYIISRSRQSASAATRAFIDVTERWVAESYAN